MFGLDCEKTWLPKEVCLGSLNPDAPVLIEGLQEYETLCPTNPLTGHRDSAVSVLRYALSDKNVGLLDQVLCELPTIKQMNAPDDVKIDTLVSALDVRYSAERDEVTTQLMKISDVLFEKGDISEPLQVDSKIEFNKDDNPNSDANI